MESWLSSLYDWGQQAAVPLLAAILSGLFAWILSRKTEAGLNRSLQENLRNAQQERESLETHARKLETELGHARERIAELTKAATKLDEIRGRLKNSTLVYTYHQPVILAGPSLVGKTSLLLQWHAPWETYPLSTTQTHYIANVPVYDDLEQQDLKPHFADGEVLVPFIRHLVLKVHDFPGQLDEQKSIREVLITETEALQRETGKNLGVVLICMFDAEEAHSGIKAETLAYYNGDLFHELRNLVSFSKVHLDRLILVFNKYDRLRRHYPSAPDDTGLLQLCVEAFLPVYRPLRGVCNPEKVCEVFTMVPRENMHLMNRGAPIVKGEAAKNFVRTICGPDAASKIIRESATTLVQPRFVL